MRHLLSKGKRHVKRHAVMCRLEGIVNVVSYSYDIYNVRQL
jgi:hypothetical protein